MVLIVIVFIIAFSAGAGAGETGIAPFTMAYSIRREKIENRTVIMKTGIVEYFQAKSGPDMLYLVFYPYEIRPEDWRDIYLYREKDPSNFLILKLEVRGKHPLKEGNYLPELAGNYDNPEHEYFVPTLITASGEYNGTHGKGNLIFERMERKMGGIMEGKIDYKDEEMEIKGNFQARFIQVQ